MALNITGFNVHPQDRWEDRSSDNQFKIDGLTSEEWVKKDKNRTYGDFWSIRNARISEGAKEMFESRRQKQVFPMDVFAVTADTSYGPSLQQMADAMPQWDKLVKMSRDKNGTIYGIDIETIGDIQNAKGVFGITEIGISKIDLAEGIRETDAKSIVLGLNLDQQEYITDLIDKYESEGWATLDKTEQSTLKRASMYRGDPNTLFREETSLGVGNILGTDKHYTVVDELASVSLNAADMRKGVENLGWAYNNRINTNVKDVLPDVINFIGNQFYGGKVKNGRIIYAANGNFDITGLRNYAKLNGISADKLADLDNQLLDNVNIIRTVAAISDQSVPQWFKDTYGIAAGADIEGQMKAFGMSGTQLHSGGSDLINEARILINEDVDIYDIYKNLISEYVADDIQKQRMLARSVGLDGYVYYVHHGTFNKENAEEFAYIPNKNGRRTSANYAITQEFWTINTEKSGEFKIGDDTKYRLVLDNYAEQIRHDKQLKQVAAGQNVEVEDVTSIVLTGNTPEELKNRLDYMSDRYTDRQVRSIAESQQNFHYKDLGRREYEKLFSPTEVLMESGKETGGFASIKKHLETEKMIREWEQRYGDIPMGYRMNSAAARTMYEAADKISQERAIASINEDIAKGKSYPNKAKAIAALHKKLMPFNNDYDAQAFLGMRKKLQNEQPLLEHIVEAVDGLDGTVVDKTVIARNIYKDVIDTVINEYQTENTKDFDNLNIMTDLTGIDIKTGIDPETNEPTISRVNGYSQDTISKGMFRNFKKMNESEIEESLKDLQFRGIIDNAQKYMDMVKDFDMTTKSSYELSMYFMSHDIGFEISKRFQEDDLDKLAKKRNSLIENLQYNTDISVDRILSDGNKTVHLKDVLIDHEDFIKDAITRRVNDAPKTIYMDRSLNEPQIQALLEDLGMDSNNHTNIDLVFGMFNGGRNHSRYGINTREGLQSYLVSQGKGKDAFLFVTRDKDSQKLYNAIIEGKYNFDSFGDLIKSGGDEFGGIIRLAHINNYYLDSDNKHVMRTMNQGKTLERFMVPKLEMRSYKTKDGEKKWSVYLNDADYTSLSMYRTYGESFLDFISEGKYDIGTRIGRRRFNNYLQDMPTSASYRNNGGQIRTMHPGPNDYMHGHEFYGMEGLEAIFRHIVTGHGEIDSNNLNIAQQIVKGFADSQKINRWNKETQEHFYNRVMDNNIFKQFIRTRMTIGTVDKDALNINVPGTDRNFFEIIKEEVMKHGEDYGFDENASRTFEKIEKMFGNELFQVGSESAVHKGSLFNINPGEFSLLGGLSSTMRPVWIQQYNNVTYDPAVLKEQIKEKMVGLSTSKFSPLSFGNTPMEESEYVPMYSLRGQTKITEERTFMAKFKYMSDRDLQDKLNSLTLKAGEGFRNDVKNTFGLTDEEYTELVGYAKSNIFSFHEDKGIHAPGLKETDLLAAREAMTYKLNMDMLDEKKTEKALYKILNEQGGVIKDGQNDIIAFKKNGSVLYYNGPEAILTEDNIRDIIYENDGVTKLALTKGSIVDDKFMLNGSEKFTSHTSLDVSRVEKITGLNYDKALELANRVHGYIFDGAAFALNPKSAKHGSVNTAISDFLTIYRRYEEAGKGDVFTNYLNNLISDKSNAKIAEGLSEFKHYDRLVGDLAHAQHGALFVERVLNDVRKSASGKGKPTGLIKSIDKDIVEELEEMSKKNISFAFTTRQMMTEFVGKKYRMDQRTNQSMRMRGMTYSHDGGNGVLETSARIADDIKEYSMNYDGKGTGLREAGYDTLQKFVDAVSAGKNDERIRYNTSTKDMRRTVGGIVETVNNVSDPVSSKSIRNKNIVTFDIYDLIDSLNIGKSGSTTEELQSSIFFINGEPSKLLEQRAKEQGKNLLDESYSIFIKMDREFKIGDKTTDGFLIPIQSINGSLIDDKHYFQNQQKETTSFLNKAIHTILEPKDNDFDNLVDNYTGTYIPNIAKELNFMKKDADITKAFQEYIVPTSSYMLGQDETSPLLKSQMGRKWTSAVNKVYKAEEKLQKDFTSQKAIDEYAEAVFNLQKMINDDADKIDHLLDDNWYYEHGETRKFSQYQALSKGDQKKFGDALIVKDVNGYKHHGMGIAMSEEAFERSGFDFGATAMDLVADMEKMADDRRYAGSYEGMRKFNSKHKAQLQQLKEDMAKIEFEYFSIQEQTDVVKRIDPTKHLMPQLEEIFTDANLNINSWEVSIKKLNKEIAQGTDSGFMKVFRMFKQSGIAQDYMSEVGTYSQFLRSPIFRSQLVMKTMLDRSLDGYQVRALDAVTSLITNLDFDGDIPAILQRLNGMSIMKNTAQVFKDYAEEWMRFAINDHHHLLADLIRDGVPFRRENATASRLQQATLLKIIDEEAYNNGLDKFLKTYEIFDDIGNRIASLDGLDGSNVSDSLKEAIEFAANNSDIMSDAFENSVGNTLTNEKMTLAAYAAKIRKDYIGSVSTPAYKLRSTLMDVMRDESLTQEQKDLLNDVLVGMSNMFSEHGGFLSVSEQRGIDTKWAQDAQKYSQLSDWAGSMISLLRNDKPENTYNNVRSMIEAVGVNVFKFKPNDTHKADVYTELILNVDSDTFRNAYQDAKRNGGKFNFGEHLKNVEEVKLGRDEIQELWAMHDLVEAINKVPQLSEVFKERYDGDAAVEFAKKVRNMDNDAFEKLVKQTFNAPVHEILPVLRESISKDTFMLDTGKVYFNAGSLFDKNPNPTLYMYKGSGKFEIIDSDKSVITPKHNRKLKTESSIKYAPTGSVKISDKLKEVFSEQTSNPMISELRHDKAAQESLISEMESSMVANTLNKIILDDNGLVREHEWSRFSSMLSKNWKDKDLKAIGFGDIDRGNATIDSLANMFDPIVYDEVSKFAKVYDYAVSRGDKSGNSADLIRALNKKIADEGWKDHSGINITDYDVMLRPYIMEAFNGEDNYNKYLDLAINLPDFNKTEYNKALDSLSSKAYDINGLKEALSGQYDRLYDELRDLPASGYTDDDLKPIHDFIHSNERSRYIQQKINDLQQENVIIASEAEESVYKMFRNSNQLDKHFGFDGSEPTEDMIVGFGELMGHRFGDLSQSDIDYIMEASFDQYVTDTMNPHTREMLSHAIEETKKNLENYTPKTSASAFNPNSTNKIKTDEVIKNVESELTSVFDKVFESFDARQTEQDTVKDASEEAAKHAAETAESAATESAEKAAETMGKHTLHDEWFTRTKETFENLNINKKTIGVVAGALAALGILNNVVHNERPHSPLSPSRTSSNNNDPYLNNKETQFQAPPSPKSTKTVYHHNGSGLNFKVSAKTKQDIDDQNKARLIGRAGGGQPSIHTYADTSGINNNWLQNKFAELMN